MFQHILVPLDGSVLAECVLPNLVSLVKVWHPRVSLLSVLDPNTGKNPIDPLEWQLQKTEAEAYLKAVLKRVEHLEAQAEAEVLEGNAAEVILEYVIAHNVDLILLSSHGQSGISGWNVSSTVQKVISRAGVSIMLVRAYLASVQDGESVHYQRILIPLDGSPRAESVLQVAEMIARVHESEILAIHVVRKPEIPRRTPPTQEDLELTSKLTELNRLEAFRYMDELSSRVDARMDTHVIISESVLAALQQQVEQYSVDLVIVSAHGYSGGTKWPYGSVATGFITYGTTPLLVIQDLPHDRIEPMQSELIAKERGKR